MAKADDRRDDTIRPPGIKYPWAQWQDGRWWTITRNEDFSVTVQSMRDQLHTRAKATDVKVVTKTDRETQINFTFQVEGETEEEFTARAKAGQAAENAR